MLDVGRHQIDLFLSNPASHGCAEVRRIETHGSLVYLAGDRAYKLKRPVAFSSLDYSTLARREAACRAELALNRRTAPELYLGIGAIRRREDGRIGFDGEGETLDWVVVMRRFDEADLFDRLAAEGRLTADGVVALADELASFHAAAARAEGGGAAGLAMAIDHNRRDLETVARLFGSRAIDTLHEASRGELARLAGVLDRRRAEGQVLRGHGDLRLANICLMEGRPTLFDAVEFSDDVACVDRLFDLAFLLADLRQRGLAPFANLLFNRYLDVTGDGEGESLSVLPLMLSVRTATRAYALAGLSIRHAEQAQAARFAVAAQAHLAEAAALLSPGAGQVLAVGGVSGTTKLSTVYRLAALCGPAPGARVLRGEVQRHRLMGIAVGRRLPAAAYEPDVTRRAYAALAEGAADTLRADCTAILEADFADGAQRRSLQETMGGAGFTGLWLGSPAELGKGEAARWIALRPGNGRRFPALLRRLGMNGSRS